MAVSMGYKAMFGSAGGGSRTAINGGGVAGKPSTSGTARHAVFGAGGGHNGKGRPGGGTGGKGKKSASYAIPKNKLR